jgi:mercuric ion transport protein
MLKSLTAEARRSKFGIGVSRIVIAASQIVALHAGFERLIHPLDVLPPSAISPAASPKSVVWLLNGEYLSTWCRLHPMQTATKHLWAGVLAAIVGSLCCVAPLVLLTLGISGAWISQLTALEPYRPIFIGVMLVFIGLAFRRLYIVPARCAPDAVCANSRLQRRQRQIFWFVVIGLAVLIAFPWYAPLLFS